MTVNTTLVPAALALLFGSGWAMAQEQTMDPAGQTMDPAAQQQEPATEAPDFSAVDADGDGAISISEAARVPGLVEQFGTLDTSGTGALTEEEYAAFTPGRAVEESQEDPGS